MFKLLRISLVAAMLFSAVPLGVAATPRTGAKCPKLGQVITQSNFKYTCTKSGKNLVWKQEKIRNATSLPSPRPTFAIDPSQTSNSSNFDDTTSQIQQFLNGIVISDFSSKMKLILDVEPGPNGNFPDLLKEKIKQAIDFYGSTGLLPNSSEVYFAIGRTQEWMDEKASLNCKKVDLPIQSAAMVGTCITNKNRIGIIANLPFILQSNSKSDFSLIKVDTSRTGYSCGLNCLTESSYLSFLNQPAHELFHAYQDYKWSTLGNRYIYFPQWFIEGTAETFSRMALAKFDGGKDSFFNQTKDFYKHFYGGPDGSQNCEMSFGNLYHLFDTKLAQQLKDGVPFRSDCAYSLGSLASDALVVNIGGIKKFDVLMSELVIKDFANAILATNNLSLDLFIQSADRHAKNYGYASKA